jgi:hypothetical protein
MSPPIIKAPPRAQVSRPTSPVAIGSIPQEPIATEPPAPRPAAIPTPAPQPAAPAPTHATPVTPPVQDVPKQRLHSALPNFAAMTENDLRIWDREIMTKHTSMISHFPELRIAPLDPNFDVETKFKMYHNDHRLVKIHVNKNLYKLGFTVLFLGIEAFLTRVLGLRAGGYTKYQVTMMRRYEMYLTEIGEIDWLNIAEEYPAWIKILLFSVGSALVFVAFEYAMQWFGSNELVTATRSAVHNMLMGDTPPVPASNGTEAIAAAAIPGAPTSGLPSFLQGLDLGNLAANFGSMFAAPSQPLASEAPPHLE